MTSQKWHSRHILSADLRNSQFELGVIVQPLPAAIAYGRVFFGNCTHHLLILRPSFLLTSMAT